jgi:hypothetical protein
MGGANKEIKLDAYEIIKLKLIQWFPGPLLDRPPTKRQRLSWILRFGQDREGLEKELSKPELKNHLALLSDMVKNFYGASLLWFWQELEEEPPHHKVSEQPPLSAKNLPEIWGLLITTLLEAQKAVSDFIRETLLPLKEGTETIRPIRCLATFYIESSLLSSITGDKTLHKKQYRQWSTEEEFPVKKRVRGDVEWGLSELLDGFSLDEIKICEECGKLFVPLKKPTKSKYCSRTCQNRAAWTRHKIKQATKKGG